MPRRLIVALVMIFTLSLALAAPDVQAQVGVTPSDWSSPAKIDPWFDPASTSCPTASFCMAVGYGRGGAAATYDGSAWSRPTQLGGAEGVGTVSCPSASFCVAVGGKEAFIFNGSSWSAPSVITSASWLRSVSCASAIFCVAVDNEGDALTYDGQSWSGRVKIDDPERLTSVSCPSASFCMAVDDEGYAVPYEAGTWGSPTKTPGPGFTEVSCASALLCIGSTEYFEAAPVYDGTSWHQSTPHARVESISCYSTSFCEGVGGGVAVTYDGSSWGAATTIGIGADSVACGSRTFCVALAYDSKDAVSDQGGSWSAPVALGGQVESLSCPPSTECVAVDDNGRSLTYDGESWSEPQVVDGVVPLESVSCPTDAFCMAVDGRGRALSRTAGVWGGPLEVDAESNLTSVSCATSSFCSAVDRDGNAFIYENGSWREDHRIDQGESGQGLPLSSVSCPSIGFCVAVDELGRTFTYSSGSWSHPDVADTWGLMSVSCGSASFCAAVDWQGGALIGGGGTWGSRYSVADELRSVSCTADSTCVAGGVGEGWLAGVNHGYVSVFSGGAWSEAVSVDRESIDAVSCPSESFCVAADADGDVLTAGVPIRRPVPTVPPVSPGAQPSAPVGSSRGAVFGKTRIGRALLRGNTVRVPVGCAGPSTAACQVAVQLLGRLVPHAGGSKSGRGAWKSVGRSTVSLGGGQEKIALVPLNAMGRRLRKSGRTLSLRMVASQAEGGKPVVVSRRLIKLRAS